MGRPALIPGEDQAAKLADLIRDLRRPVSPVGDGKVITSGFAYWGVASTLAWCRACDDLTYPVMRRSIHSFEERWKAVRGVLGEDPYHYVSLGPGNGVKDVFIVRHLLERNEELCYVPVDMSALMLEIGGQKLIDEVGLSPSDQVLPLQLDFSDSANIARLRSLLDNVLDGHPVVFSLLGNTLSNFEHDSALLAMLSERLLRDDDRVIVEVATTGSLDEGLDKLAAEEYEATNLFLQWVTSPLQDCTDLTLDMDSVSFHGSIERNRCLRVVVLYTNRTGTELRLTLPDRSDVAFPADDTIRLDLTRKYGVRELRTIIADAKLDELSATHLDLSSREHEFGVELLTLKRGPGRPTSAISDGIWTAPSRQ